MATEDEDKPTDDTKPEDQVDDKPKPEDEDKPTDDTKPEDKPAPKPAAKPTVNREAAKLKTENTELQTKVTQLQDRAERLDVLEALNAAKTTAGIKEAAVVAELVIARKGELTFGDDGSVDGLSEVLDSIKTKYPSLFFNTPGSADGGAGGETPKDFNADAWFRSTLGGK